MLEPLGQANALPPGYGADLVTMLTKAGQREKALAHQAAKRAERKARGKHKPRLKKGR